jgi:hypothetical protein
MNLKGNQNRNTNQNRDDSNKKDSIPDYNKNTILVEK